MLRTVVVDLTTDERLGKDLVATGGVFAAGAKLRLDEECNLVLRAGQEELRYMARVVLANDQGAGLEIMGRTSEVREHLAAFVRIASYVTVMRDVRAQAQARARGQDTIPTMPPQAEASADKPRGKPEIVERVRHVLYDDDSAARRRAAGSIPPESRAREAAAKLPPDADGVRRVAQGSIPPKTAAAARPPVEVPLALAPTQRADALEAKALAARLAAEQRERDDEE